MAAYPSRLPFLAVCHNHCNQQAGDKVFRFAARLAGKWRAGARWRRKQVQLDHHVFPPGLSATDGEVKRRRREGDAVTRQGRSVVARLKKAERRSGRTSIGESTVPRPPRLSHEDGFPLLCVLRAGLWLSADTTGGRGNKSRFQLRDNGQYAESSFAGPEAVLAYLARYTHRVAIANSRLIAVNERRVTFKVKDYRIEGPGRYTTMTLDTGEFIRRFLSHVLPKGFHRIRHYGLL